MIRICTINKLSQETAEIFWEGYHKLRKSLNSNFNIRAGILLLSEQKNQAEDFSMIKEKAISFLKGIKRRTSHYPCGLLVVPLETNILGFYFPKLSNGGQQFQVAHDTFGVKFSFKYIYKARHSRPR